MTEQTPTQNNGSFFGLGIAPKLLEALERLSFTVPTPIQQQSIPVAIEGKDIIGIAQTGTGKTLAFGIPMIQRLAALKGKGLIVLPTRELALQVDETLQKLGSSLHLRTAVLIGGASMERQIHMIRKMPHVIVGTPGRIIDHLNQRTLKLDDVTVLVLDEADRMLDMGFLPQIKRILQTVPTERQTMLFSATMPDDIVGIAARHMKLPVRVEIARQGTLADTVTQELFVVRKDQKLRLLDKILAEYHGTVLVFSRTKFGAKKICRSVHDMGHTAAEIHSDRSLAQRRDALEGFKTGKYRVLVATDIAARGIDVNGIELVLNFDIPENPEDYVHRIGRTGRAGKSGRAISFAMPDQGGDVREIEKLARIALPIIPLPVLPADRPQSYSPRPMESGRTGGYASRGGYAPRGGFGNRSSGRPSGNRGQRPPAQGGYYFSEGPKGDDNAPQSPRSGGSRPFGRNKRPMRRGGSGSGR